MAQEVPPRFASCSSMVSDGEGCFYVISAGRLRKLQLPSSWQRAAQTADTGTVAAAAPLVENHQEAAEGQLLSREPVGAAGHESAPSPVPGEVVVSAVPCGELDGLLVTGAYDPLNGSLVLCTTHLVYRLYIGGGTGAAASAPAVSAAPAAEPKPGASSGTKRAAEATEGPESSNQQPTFVANVGDGSFIMGVAVDGAGSIWVADVQDDYDVVERTYLRKVDAVSGKRLVASGMGTLQGRLYTSPAVLHNGCLAMVSWDGPRHDILLLHLELPPPALAGPSTRSLSHRSNTFSSDGVGSSIRNQHALASDLGALLDRQPDSSADVEVEVGGQVFAAHRSVLAARSPYLAQRLDPGAGFADTGASRLSLPDADPRVFGAVLRYMYTDSAGSVPPELLQPVGELADRLLLPGLCAQVGDQLLLQVRPDTVVGLLLWAEQRRSGYPHLLTGLKAWFVGQHAAGGGRGWVLPDREVVRLMREGPEDLAVELLYHLRPDVRQCTRTRGV